MDNITISNTQKKYEAVVTNIGNELMMNAVANGEKVKISTFAAGDGNGEYYIPDTSMTALKHEVWRGNINNCKISEESPNVLIVSAICPGEAGGFTIREMGVYDTANHLIAICNCPAIPKVTVTDGVVNELRLEMELVLINGNSVELLVDPNIVTATKQDIDELWEEINSRMKVTIGTETEPMEENELRFIVETMPY